MKSNDILLTQLDSGILHLILHRPQQLNALSEALLNELHRVFKEAKVDPAVKALLLTGEGKGFCAGADITQLANLNGSQGEAFAQVGQQVFNELASLGKPSLAAIHGFAFGGGCELAMAATLRIATEKTQFGQPEIKLGVIPGFGGTQRLARLVGKGRALEICLLGKRFTAEEGKQWGFLSEVTPHEMLIPRAKAILTELTSLAPIALSSIMRTIDEGYELPLQSALVLEAAQFGLCCATQDKKEGVNAFLEKRQPLFAGE